MRTNISKMWRSGLALLMVLCMAVALFPAAAFAEEEEEQRDLAYVALGDSMTSGYGLQEGVPTYPAIVADEFGWILNNQAVSGINAAELHAMLTDGTPAAPLRAAVSGADVISLGMGNADFGTILPENAVKAASGEVYEFDLEAAVAGYPAGAQTLLTAVVDQLVSIIGGYTENTDIRDALVNTIMNYMAEYSGVLNSIMALNPDAEVILMCVLNPFNGKDVTAESETVGFSLREMLDEVLPYVNAYLAGIPAVLQMGGYDAFAAGTFYYGEDETAELMTCGCPSAYGHEALAAAAIAAYDSEYSASQKLMDSKNEILNGLVNSETNMGTHGKYVVDDDSYYVALGDSPAVSESYVDQIAGKMGVPFKNLAQSGLLAQDAAAVVTANQAEIEKADLITVGFSNVPFVTQAMITFTNGADAAPDWTSIVSEEEAVTIQGYLVAMEAQLETSGIVDPSMKEQAMDAIEGYLFNCAAYAIRMPELIDQIHAINPDALVAIIGMYNPLDGITLNMGEGMSYELGVLFDEIVDMMALYDIMYAMGHENTFYVYAPDVAIKVNKTELNSLDIYRVFLAGKGKDLNPSEEGQAYISQQILNALTVKNAALLGDVDHSGAVDFFDGMLTLQYYAGVIDETGMDVSVADVDAGGSIDFFDGMYMLQYYAGVIEKLPAEA